MIKPVVQRLNAEDIKIAKAFKNVVLQGKFEIKGEAVKMAGSLFSWFDALDLRIEETLKPVVLPPAIEPEEKKKGKK